MFKTIFLLLLIIPFELTGQNITIFGYVKDKKSGESLIGATLFVNGANYGVTTNQYGFYSLKIPCSMHKLKYSFIGYEPFVVDINLKKDTLVTVELSTNIIQLDNVTVKGNRDNKITNGETGSHTMDIATIKKVASVGGEPDIIKNLQLLPGIQVANEGTTNLSVRGGSYDQNLFLLDGAPVYNPSHALGFFSVFNADAIKSVKIYKSYFPAEYGGRSSSIVDIYMKEGNSKNATLEGGVGLIASRLTIESPIVKDKASIIISGRYSYTGQTVNTLGSFGQEMRIGSLRNFNDNNEIFFYDLNAKANYKLNDNNRLYFSVYTGKDHFFYYALNDNGNMDLSNLTGTLRWNAIINSRLFSNSTAVFSQYNYSYTINDDIRHFEWAANLSEIDLKSDFDFYLNSKNHIKFGYAIENHFYQPGSISPLDSASITKPFSLEKQRTIVGAFYIGNEQKISERFSVDYGLRSTSFFLLGPQDVYSYSTNMEVVDTAHFANGGIVQSYNSLEPRLVLNYLISRDNSIKISYSRSVQYQHLLSNSTVGLPTDMWIPANSYIKPQTANQYSVGYYRSMAKGDYEFSTEVYYRRMNNIIDFKDNADLFLNPSIETQILAGKGESMGVEFLLEKKTKKLHGWLSYTLSQTNKQIDGINQGESYHANYDKRHNLATVAILEVSPLISLSAIFKYTSGGYVSIPEGMYYYQGATFNYYSERNGYKLPDYHRLDLSCKYNFKKNSQRRVKLELDFGIYNVYGRKNIFSLFIKQQ